MHDNWSSQSVKDQRKITMEVVIFWCWSKAAVVWKLFCYDRNNVIKNRWVMDEKSLLMFKQDEQ